MKTQSLVLLKSSDYDHVTCQSCHWCKTNMAIPHFNIVDEELLLPFVTYIITSV